MTELLLNETSANGYYTFEVDKVISENVYFKSVTSNIIVELEDIVLRTTDKTIVKAKYSVLNTAKDHSGSIELYYRGKLLHTLEYSYVAPELIVREECDLLTAIHSEYTFECKASEEVITSNTHNKLVEKVNYLLGSSWANCKIEDNKLHIRVEENTTPFTRKTRLKFFISHEDKVEILPCLITQNGCPE